MPNFDYTCPNGHTFEKYRSVSRRDDPAECGTCGEAAARTAAPALWAPGSVTRNTDSVGGKLCPESGRRYRMRDRVCGEHGVVEEVASAWLDDEGNMLPPDPCPTCGKACTWEHLLDSAITPELDKRMCNGGYEDLGAGKVFTSKNERREWMKRAGVECVGTDSMAVAEEVDREQRELLARDQKNYDDYMHELTSDPEGRAALAHVQREAAEENARRAAAWQAAREEAQEAMRRHAYDNRR